MKKLRDIAGDNALINIVFNNGGSTSSMHENVLDKYGDRDVIDYDRSHSVLFDTMTVLLK